ncbi:MAG: branched-chain amino acid ABC transporter permease [Desulfovibrionaceae bacterium]|nr:branched-chain amino acid ABC transporter permease [Desulfovibrionaceae bacterium]
MADASIYVQLIISGLLIGGVYALISIGLTLIFGVMRIVNFAHGEFLMLSMFLTYWLVVMTGMSPYAALPIVAAIMFFYGAAIYALVIRRTLASPMVVQIFATVGLGMLMSNSALVFWTADYRMLQSDVGAQVLHIAGVQIGVAPLIAFVVAIIVAVALFVFIAFTYTGRSIRATVQDKAAAQLMGVNIDRVFMLTFALGALLVGIAGALLAPIFPVYPTVGITFGTVSFVVVVLGGMGSMTGALLGGLIIGLVETLSGFFIDTGLKQAVYFAVFILVLIFRPNGLFGQKGAEEIGL